MKCPNCGNEMVESRAGHLCISCGHIEVTTAPPAPADAPMATGKAGHDMSRDAAGSPSASAPTSTPTDTATSAATPADAEAKPGTVTPSEPVAGPEPAAEAEPEAKTETKPESEAKSDAASPAVEPESVPHPESALAPETNTESDIKALENAVAAVESSTESKAVETGEPKSDLDVTDAATTEAPTAEAAAEAEKAATDALAALTGAAPEGGKVSDDKDDKDEEEATAAPAEETSDSTPIEVKIAGHQPRNRLKRDGEEADEGAKADEPSKPADEPKPAEEPKPVPQALSAHAPQMPSYDRPAEIPAPHDTANPQDNDSQPEPAPVEAAKPADEPTTPAVEPTNPIASETGAVAVPALEPEAPVASAPTGKPPLTPVTHPRPINWALTVGLILGLLLLLGAAALGYFYLVAPKMALGQYFDQLTGAKASRFSTTITADGQGYHNTFRVVGANDMTDTAKPKLDAAVSADVAVDKNDSSGLKTGSAAGHITLVDSSVYFKIDNQDILPLTLASDWFKINPANDTDSRCATDPKRLQALLSKNFSSNLPITDARFEGLDDLDGQSALKYSGALDNGKLQQVVDAANQGVATDCQVKLSASLKETSVKYQLWRGRGTDRLQVALASNHGQDTTTIVFNTSSYGKQPNIKAPANAKDAGGLFSHVLGAATFRQPSTLSTGLTDDATPAPAPSTTGDAASRDTQRQAALAQYVAAYKAAFPKGFYAKTIPAVTVTATDPSTVAAYTVSSGAPGALGQIQYKIGGACTGRQYTPGPNGSRHLALLTLLESGSQYCLDVK